MRAIGTALVLALSFARPGAAQGVVVAPHVAIIDHRTRSAALTLYNPGSEPAEVTISTFFGYPVTDSLGEFELTTPLEDGSLPSAARWVEAYPKRMTIRPLERQTVRLLGRPPADLPDGEYWSRIMIAAKGGKPAAVTVDSAPPGIQVGLDLEVRTIIPLQYRKGSVSTGLRLESPRAVRMGDSLIVRVAMSRTGNAAFVGTARGSLFDRSNQVVGTFTTPLAIYRSIDPRLPMVIRGLTPGRYRLEVVLTTDRVDLPPEQLLQTAPAKTTLELDLP